MTRPRCISIVATALSLAVFVSAAWLWHRSLHTCDYYYRLELNPAGGTAMRGFGSYRGAALVGSIVDTTPANTAATDHYQHQSFPLAAKGSGSVLKATPTRKVSALGFGMSDGDLKITLPLLSFFVPQRTYHVVYVPYYFIMLLALVQPLRLALRLSRATRTPADPTHLAGSLASRV